MEVVTKENFRLGAGVVRGPKWNYDDQDSGGKGHLILHTDYYPSNKNSYWCCVRWDLNNYSEAYELDGDLQYCEKTIKELLDELDILIENKEKQLKK